MRKATEQAIELRKQAIDRLIAAREALSPLEKSLAAADINMLCAGMQDAVDALRENGASFEGVYVDWESQVGNNGTGSISGAFGILVDGKFIAFNDGSYCTHTLETHTQEAGWDHRQFDYTNDENVEEALLEDMPAQLREALSIFDETGWFSTNNEAWHELLGIYGHDGFQSREGELHMTAKELQHMLKKKGLSITL